MRDATAVFGLSKAQLLPIVNRIVFPNEVTSFDVSVEHKVLWEHYGWRGDKVIPTFSYTSRLGHTGKTTVFVKRHGNVGPYEAYHYTYLVEHRAPIPKMYGAITGPEQKDIVFLEYLNPVTDNETLFLKDADRFPEFLSVTARFNAIQPREDYAAKLPRDHWNERVPETVLELDTVWLHGCGGELGDGLRRLCSAENLSLLRAVKGVEIPYHQAEAKPYH